MSEGPVNLNWAPIMKTVNESPYDFFQHGGWSFLGTGDESGGSGGSDTESEFAADSAEMVDEESSDDASDFDASDDASDSGNGSDFGSEESEGMCYARVSRIKSFNHLF